MVRFSLMPGDVNENWKSQGNTIQSQVNWGNQFASIEKTNYSKETSR